MQTVNGKYRPNVNALGKTVPVEWLERFYAIAFKQGMERAAEIAMDIDMEVHGVLPIRAALIAKYIQDAIRAHAKNPPESTHDGSVTEGN